MQVNRHDHVRRDTLGTLSLVCILAAVFLVLLFATKARAQLFPPSGTSANGQALVTAGQLATQGATTYYVAPTGIDASWRTCLNPALPCASQQGAYNKKPKGTQHQTIISLACGTYPQGAYVTGDDFVYDTTNGGGYAPDAGFVPSVIFTGSWDAGVLASGQQSGAIVSATAGGTTNPSVYGTFSVTDAGWTTNDLANRYVQIIAGTDVGEIRSIVSNTNVDPGVATIAGTWAVTPDSTSRFAILAPCSIVQNGLAEENPQLPTQIGVGASQAAYIVREPTGASFLTPQVVIQNIEINVVNAGKGIVTENPGTNLLVQNVTLVNGASSASVSNARAFVVNTAGASVTVLNSVFAPSFQLQGLANNALLNTIPTTINSPTYVYGGIVVRNSIFAYGAITGNVGPIVMFGGQLSTWQNSMTGNGAFVVDLQGARWISQGDQLTANSSATAVVSANFFSTANAYYTHAVFLSDIFAGSGAGTTVGLNCDTNIVGAHTVFAFDDANSTVSNFSVAYRIAGYNCTLSGGDSSGFIPTPVSSGSSDIQFGELKAAYSMAQLKAQHPFALIDSLSGDAIYGDGEQSHTTFLPGGYNLLQSIPTASLLACDALHTGAIAFDSTKLCATRCDGTNWICTDSNNVLRGCDAGTGGNLSVHFAVPYSVAPSCTCSDTSGTVTACDVTARTTTDATFKTTGTDTACWDCGILNNN